MTTSAGAQRMGVTATVVSVNVGRPREVQRNGRPAETAIWETPVTGRVRAHGVNLDGDDQADRKAHGGPDKAIYAYAAEDRHWWEAELGRDIDVGGFGENLTTQGIDLTAALIGERWRVGTTLLEVSEPRIIEQGDIAAEDRIEIVAVPDHELTIGEIAHIYHHHRQTAGRLLAIDPLSDAWKAWAQNALDRQNAPDNPTPR